MSTLHLPRLQDADHPRLSMLVHAFWAVCGSVVIVFILLAALGAFDPSEAVEVTAVALALATLWVAHSWRQLWRDERRADGG